MNIPRHEAPTADKWDVGVEGIGLGMFCYDAADFGFDSHAVTLTFLLLFYHLQLACIVGSCTEICF